MSIPQSVAEVLREHVTLEIEGIDRMYLNVYVPELQREGGVASFFRYHRGPAISMNIPLCNATLVFGPFVALSVVAPALLWFDWGYPYCSSGLSRYPCKDRIPA